MRGKKGKLYIFFRIFPDIFNKNNIVVSVYRSRKLYLGGTTELSEELYRLKTVIRVTSNFVMLKSRPRIERFRIGEIRVFFSFFFFIFFFLFFTFRYEHRNRPNCFNVHNTRARDPRAITSEAHPLRTSPLLRNCCDSRVRKMASNGIRLATATVLKA